MSKELTADDLADYWVSYMNGDGSSQERMFRGAYLTTEDRMPGLLLLKDHEHRTVAFFKTDLIVSVERKDIKPAPEGTYISIPPGCLCAYTWATSSGLPTGSIVRNGPRSDCPVHSDEQRIRDAMAGAQENPGRVVTR